MHGCLRNVISMIVSSIFVSLSGMAEESAMLLEHGFGWRGHGWCCRET